jgi:hypothetical protein
MPGTTSVSLTPFRRSAETTAKGTKRIPSWVADMEPVDAGPHPASTGTVIWPPVTCGSARRRSGDLKRLGYGRSSSGRCRSRWTPPCCLYTPQISVFQVSIGFSCDPIATASNGGLSIAGGVIRPAGRGGQVTSAPVRVRSAESGQPDRSQSRSARPVPHPSG